MGVWQMGKKRNVKKGILVSLLIFLSPYKVGSKLSNILWGRDVLQRGAKWKVECGDFISIWLDQWFTFK